MTTPCYLAAELAARVRDVHHAYDLRLTSFAIFQLRHRGLWSLIEREGLTLDVRIALAQEN